MIYQRQFLKETTITAIAVFVVILAILVFTQGITLLGRAAGGNVAIDAVGTLIGFWVLNLAPLLLVLTAYISTLTVLTRYWRDSEMAIWLSSGLGLRQWVKPVMTFALPLMLLIAVLQIFVLPWAELRSREYAELLKQKQNLSLVEQGKFTELGKKNGRIYFVEQFDAHAGQLNHLFLREIGDDGKNQVIFAESGQFTLEGSDQHRTLVLHNGYRYLGNAGQGDFEQIAFKELRLATNTTPKLANPIDHRNTIPTIQLLRSKDPVHQAELMWRISLPITVVVLCWLAIPISYFNPRSGNSYHVLVAVGFFLVYQNSLTWVYGAMKSGKISFWPALLSVHGLTMLCAWLLMRVRSLPAQPFWRALRRAFAKQGKPT